MSSLTIISMSISTILTSIWYFNRGIKLRKTKDIEKYSGAYFRKVKDIDGYINLYCKMYFSNGVFLIALGVFTILNEYYFNLSINLLLILLCIVFIFIFIKSFIIERKIKKFIY